jgi:hypothetical protein
MTTEEIRRLIAHQPFEPFRLLVADGRDFDVSHPEAIAIAGNGRLVAIGMPDYFVTLDVFLVTGVQRPIPATKNGKRRRSS